MTAEKQKGLYVKYIISRADGTPIDSEDEYFVLKVAGKGDKKHIEACRRAIIKYADEIADHLPDLSQSILDRYDYVECENCEVKLFNEDDIIRDSEWIPLCKECYDALKGDPGFYHDEASYYQGCSMKKYNYYDPSDLPEIGEDEDYSIEVIVLIVDEEFSGYFDFTSNAWHVKLGGMTVGARRMEMYEIDGWRYADKCAAK